MGNCLFTQLKGAVDNPNLPVYSAIEFIVKAGNFTIGLSVPKGTIINFDNTVDVINNGSGAGSRIQPGWVTPYEATPTTNNIRLNGTLTRDTKFSLVGAKYGTVFIDSVAVTINSAKITALSSFAETVKYNTMVVMAQRMIDSEIELPVSAIKGNSLVRFGFSQTDKPAFRGTLTDLLRFTLLEEIYVNSSNNSFAGRVVDLAPLTKLTTVMLQRNSVIQGSLEELVEAMCINRVGTVENPEVLAIDMRYTAATFHGAAPELSSEGFFYVTFLANSVTVENHARNTLATYNKTSHTWSYN